MVDPVKPVPDATESSSDDKLERFLVALATEPAKLEAFIRDRHAAMEDAGLSPSDRSIVSSGNALELHSRLINARGSVPPEKPQAAVPGSHETGQAENSALSASNQQSTSSNGGSSVMYSQPYPYNPQWAPQAWLQFPQVHPQIFPQVHPQIFPQVHPQIFPQVHPQIFPQVHPQIFPQVHPQIFPQVHPQIFPQVHPQIFPQVHPQIFPQVHPQIFPQVYPQIFPQVHPQIFPQVHPQIFPQAFIQPPAQG